MATWNVPFNRPQPRFVDSIERLVAALAVAVAELRRQRRRTRDLRHLLQLDDRLLADIGVTRHEVERRLASPSAADEAWPLYARR